MSNTFMSSPSLMFTSESVTEGHPDKICDQISDAVLDACLEQDPMSRVACETAVKTGFVALLGEITTSAYVNFDELVRKVVNEIGYDSSDKGFDGNTCAVLSAVASQSADIALGVDHAMEDKSGEMKDVGIEHVGAGDQGMLQRRVKRMIIRDIGLIHVKPAAGSFATALNFYLFHNHRTHNSSPIVAADSFCALIAR